MVDPVFLTLDEVKEIHEQQIARFGGTLGIRDEGGLASAVAQAEAWFGGNFLHPFPFGMAAAYAFHIAEAQAFLDGNKRAALNTALTFLEVNGFDVSFTPELEKAMLAVAAKILDKDGLALLFENITLSSAT